jgi:hypothetical protein
MWVDWTGWWDGELPNSVESSGTVYSGVSFSPFLQHNKQQVTGTGVKADITNHIVRLYHGFLMDRYKGKRHIMLLSDSKMYASVVSLVVYLRFVNCSFTYTYDVECDSDCDLSIRNGVNWIGYGLFSGIIPSGFFWSNWRKSRNSSVRIPDIWAENRTRYITSVTNSAVMLCVVN